MAEKKSKEKSTATKKATCIKITKANGRVIINALENKQQYLDNGYKGEEV